MENRLAGGPAFAESLRQALRAVEHAYVGVVLVGSEEAWKALEKVRAARWEAVTVLLSCPYPEQRTKLLRIGEVFADQSKEITDLARRELGLTRRHTAR